MLGLSRALRKDVPRGGCGAPRQWTGGRVTALVGLVGLMATVGVSVTGPTAAVAQAPVGQGFNLNASDLRFILKQIKIAERHADTVSGSTPCSTMRGAGPDQIPAGEVGDTLPWGLRQVDGRCNNLVAGRPSGHSWCSARPP